jgi:hypothetical protein
MPFGSSETVTCKVCNETFDHYKRFSIHIKKHHQLSPEQYYITHELSGEAPRCQECSNTPRFVSLRDGFKKFCHQHANLACSLAGSLGGKNKHTWNKDKVHKEDSRIEIRSGEQNSFFGRKHSDESIEKISKKKRLSFDEVQTRFEETQKVHLISTLETYKTQNSLLEISCNTCGEKDHVSLFNFQRCWRCKRCDPLGSRPQVEILDFVRKHCYAESSTRKIIPPLEIDVWVPEKSVGIEYHGLYWHSKSSKDQVHAKKQKLASKKGIRLLQFFSDEWRDKRNICESMIGNVLGLNQKLNARDCQVVNLSSKESSQFVDDNHISGATRAKFHVGLIHRKLGLVAVGTARIPIQKKWGNVLELARMCFLQNTTVRGGASKLLKEILKLSIESGFDGLLSYADLRTGTGNVYAKCGMKLVGETKPSYWYTDGQVRFDRFKFRAQSGFTEKQVAENNNVRPIWGCGNSVYLLLKE